ncbi:hypothetical protein PVA45_01185 [Entomospira entomophila]|uniref:Uncharacterized protein n=1 Tax=Entomospira entomophila TaxID=2719988 RepID=A0A968G8Z5_9SPIO|nr:hypothetical protein [Entomospira entomophilus]NIZ40132.1 hypothetical protein [Entomospira entomophilus]WDI35691.1 hypothetical protein PVA45_01185 [Entomospira entomophilus]
MSQYAQHAHQELLAAINTFSQEKNDNYVDTINHAMTAVHCFLPMLTQNENASLAEQITLCRENPIVQSNTALMNLLNNLHIYDTQLYHPYDKIPQSKEALLIISLCNDILSQCIPLVEHNAPQIK